MSPGLFLLVFLPVLLFGSAFSFDFYTFKGSMRQVGMGVFIESV